MLFMLRNRSAQCGKFPTQIILTIWSYGHSVPCLQFGFVQIWLHDSMAIKTHCAKHFWPAVILGRLTLNALNSEPQNKLARAAGANTMEQVTLFCNGAVLQTFEELSNQNRKEIKGKMRSN